MVVKIDVEVVDFEKEGIARHAQQTEIMFPVWIVVRIEAVEVRHRLVNLHEQVDPKRKWRDLPRRRASEIGPAALAERSVARSPGAFRAAANPPGVLYGGQAIAVSSSHSGDRLG